MGKWLVVECECGWRVWREIGWTKKEASEAYWQHKRTDCPLVPWRE